MDYYSLFKAYLFSHNPRLSENTVKNYLADLRKFLAWFMQYYRIEFSPLELSNDTIEKYKHYLLNDIYRINKPNINNLSARSYDRNLSTLRKFVNFLISSRHLDKSPSDLLLQTMPRKEDIFLLESFKNSLYLEKASNLTIKNYVIDIQLFIDWLNSVKSKVLGSSTEILELIQTSIIEEYKTRLQEENLNPNTINRKLSSLRKYISFLSLHYPNIISPIYINNLPYNSDAPPELKKPVIDFQNKNNNSAYSSFPPYRLLQKIFKVCIYLFDAIIIVPLAELILALQYLIWLSSGKKLFILSQKINTDLYSYIQARINRRKSTHTQPFSTNFFAPLNMNPANKKGALAYKYYKNYQKLLKNPLFAYANFSLLTLLLAGLLTYIYVSINPLISSRQILGASTAQRLISFSGKLLNKQAQPIYVPTNVRFAIYNDPTASKSALLWQDVQIVKPSKDGSFSITLGYNQPLPSVLFSENPALFLGTTINSDSELTPRQPLPTSELSNNSQTLQGMTVVSQTTDPRNTILALDSTGNLHIGVASTFSSTNGVFSLSGQNLFLTSNLNSNGNVVLSPDGLGRIDIQKPLVNTTYNGGIPGLESAVEVDDQLAVNATTSAEPALQIIQNNTGPLISASSSGANVFLVDYLGGGKFADNLAVNGDNLTSSSTTFNLLNTNVMDLLIGGYADQITIGTNKGTTTIASLTTALQGDLTIAGTSGATLTADNTGIDFSGEGNHLIRASSGTLQLGNTTLTDTLNLNQGVTIIPNNDGSNDLGSGNNHFGTLYVNNISGINSFSLTGPLGVGNTNPQFKLDVLDNQDSSSVALIKNSSDQPNASVLSLQIGANSSSQNSQSNSFINFLNGDGNLFGSINNASQSGGITLQSSAIGDFAEYLPKNPTESIPAGALVCLNGENGVTQCDDTHSQIAGAVSTHPTILAGNNQGANSIIVGMQGQIEVQVSTLQGVILSGDPISVSEIPGVGVKATSTGPIIGHALNDYTNPNPYLIGKIIVLVQPSWFDPGISITDAGNLSIDLSKPDQSPNQNTFNLKDSFGNIIRTTAGYSKALIADLTAGIIKARQIVVSSSLTAGQIATDSLVINGSSLKDYIYNIVQQIDETNNNLNSISIARLHSNIISPLGSNSAVLVQGSLQINGDASISGQLSSQNLQTHDATVSGTLYAGKIIASQIEGLPTASPSATYVTNIYNATPSADLSNQNNTKNTIQQNDTNNNVVADSQTVQSLTQQPILTAPKYISIASMPVDFTDVTNLNIQTAQVSQGLINTGPTSLSDTAVAGQLSIDNQLILAKTGINVLGADLELQPLRQGGINFLSGLVSIDTFGNLTVNGNAHFAKDVSINGNLSAHIISPLAGQDLSLDLDSSSDSAKLPSLIVNNASGSSVLSLNQSGDLVSSGSGNFTQLVAKALTIVRGAQADTSNTVTVASSSAGTAVIYKGQTERTIITPFVKSSSLIYITPTSNTYKTNPYIARQSDGDEGTDKPASFTIQISSPAVNDIHVNWWIVN